jgi:hypothetical protein
MCLLISCSKIIDEFVFTKVGEKTAEAGFVEYNIPKGKHYAEGNIFKALNQAELRFEVLFDSSAIYKNMKAENQYDINKLYGFSDCESAHHANSARFGWRWTGKRIELHAYWYDDSIRQSQFLDTISIGNATTLSIKVLPKQYMFEIKEARHFFPRHCSSSVVNGYKLYPYFGGDEPAPHDIRIKIRDL